MSKNQTNNKTTWEQIQAMLGDSSVADQVRFAELAKVEVPQAARDQAAAETAAAKALAGLKLTYGSGGAEATPEQASRVYLAGPSHKVGVGEKAGGTKTSYTEVRALDAEIAFLITARDRLKAAGFNTSPAENAGLGINQARAAGFKVSTAKDVDPSKVYGAGR